MSHVAGRKTVPALVALFALLLAAGCTAPSATNPAVAAAPVATVATPAASATAAPAKSASPLETAAEAFELGHYGEARQLAAQAAEAAPDNAECLAWAKFYDGTFLFSQGQSAEALAALQEAAKLLPDNGQVQYYLLTVEARAARATDDFDTYYKKCAARLALRPNDARVTLEMADAELLTFLATRDEKFRQQAVGHLAAAAKLSPQKGDDLFAQDLKALQAKELVFEGSDLLNAEQYAAAATKFRAALAANSADASANYSARYGLFLAESNEMFYKKDYDGYLRQAEEFSKQQPEMPVAVFAAASAASCKFAVTGDEKFKKLALDYLAQACQLTGPDDPETIKYAMRIQHRLDTRDILSAKEFAAKYPNGYQSPNAAPPQDTKK